MGRFRSDASTSPRNVQDSPSTAVFLPAVSQTRRQPFAILLSEKVLCLQLSMYAISVTHSRCECSTHDHLFRCCRPCRSPISGTISNLIYTSFNLASIQSIPPQSLLRRYTSRQLRATGNITYQYRPLGTTITITTIIN